MKTIIDPGSVHLENLLGQKMREPVTDSNGQPVFETANGQRVMKMRDAVATLREFCLGLLAVPAFIGDKTGYEAAELVLSARKAIAAWKDGPGPKLLEDEHHRGLARVVKDHPFEQTVAHNLVPFMRAVVDAKDAAAAILAAPDEPTPN